MNFITHFSLLFHFPFFDIATPKITNYIVPNSVPMRSITTPATHCSEGRGVGKKVPQTTSERQEQGANRMHTTCTPEDCNRNDHAAAELNRPC